MGKLVGALDKGGDVPRVDEGEKKLPSDTDQARLKAKIGAGAPGAVGDEINRYTNLYSFGDTLKARKSYGTRSSSPTRRGHPVRLPRRRRPADRFQSGGAASRINDARATSASS